jgi:hypothetical protein
VADFCNSCYEICLVKKIVLYRAAPLRSSNSHEKCSLEFLEHGTAMKETSGDIQKYSENEYTGN